MIALTDRAVAILLLTLRVVPVLAFSPPFTLFRIPPIVRMLMSIAMAAWIVAAAPAQTYQADFSRHGLFLTAIGELTLGVAMALALQFAFAALLTVGRAIDIQAGYGLAVLVDPTTRSQMPLVGTVFAYAAAAIFFSGSGPTDLLAIWSASVTQIPLGSVGLGGDIGRLLEFVSGAFVAACAIGGTIMLALFLSDLAIAFMSRTLPQMNVMLLGFQVKALVTLALLPLAVATGGTLIARLLRLALETTPDIMAAVGHG